jgi:hypothetical protein
MGNGRQTSDIKLQPKRNEEKYNEFHEGEGKYFLPLFHQLRLIARIPQGIHRGVPLQCQFTIYKNKHVIANEVKQSHKSEFILLRRSTFRNDNDGFN